MKVDESTSDDESPLTLLRQCQRTRRELVARIQRSFEHVSSEILPLFAEGSRTFRTTGERRWSVEHLDFTLQAIQDLETLYRQIEQLFRCYQVILAASSLPEADIIRKDSSDAKRQTDMG